MRVVQGEVFDVAVDIRRHSRTFGHWIGLHLSAENKKQLWIPEGFAHGFLVLSETAECVYKTTNYYVPEYERCIAWNDRTLNIDWQVNSIPQLSSKDSQGVCFEYAEVFE